MEAHNVEKQNEIPNHSRSVADNRRNSLDRAFNKGNGMKEAMKLALDFVASISPAFICEATHHKKNEQHESNEPCPHVKKQKQTYEALEEALAKQEQGEPLEYWNAVEGWVKIDEVREHFDSVSCGTIYKNGGEGRVPLCLAQPQQEQGEPVAWMDIDEKGAASGLRYWSEPYNRHEVALYIKDKNT